MGMVVQHNMSAMNANRNLGITVGNLSKSTEKLSSGYKINRAGDNAAGLAISEKMRGQIRGLDQASSNSEDGISMIQTAEGALSETHSILQRMRELAVQAASDTNTDDDRTQIQNEIDQLTQEVDRIATTTEFNTKKLLDGSAKGSVTEKAGKANVDATFGNSNVSAEITTDGSAKAAFTDVIRVEITADFTEGQSTKNTQKYTESELKAAYTAINNEGDATTNIDKAISAAIDTLTTTPATGLDALKDTADTSAKAIKTNDKAISDFVESLETTLKTVANDANNKNGTTLLNDGVTLDDVSKAIDKIKEAWISSGQTTTKPDTLPESVAVAEKELEALFNTTATDTTNDKITALGAKDINLVDATNTDAKVSTTGTATTVGAAATDYISALKNAAKQLATVEIQNAKDNVAVDEQQRKIDILEDTELAKAAFEYYKADANKTAATNLADKDIAQAAMDVAKSKIDELNKDKSVLTVTDLFGNTDSTQNFEIGSKVDEDNNLTITLKNKEGDNTVITISNADKLKAGDVITITAQEMVETEQAATGKEAFRLQVGANAGQEVALGINSMKAKDLNIVQTKDGVEGQSLDVTSQASASLAINAYDMAIQQVSTERAKMGAMQNRLEHTIANLDTSSENLQSAESSLRDTDMAEEMTRYSKNNILQQAGQSMLAQANQSTQGVLSLLG